MMIKSRPVSIPADSIGIQGDLSMPAGSTAIVVFAHGSGSSRHSPRNKYVAQVLNDAGIATLLIDLLTADEEAVDVETAHLRFDIDLLAERLSAATDWVCNQPATEGLHLGYFGASTGAAAALVSAARYPEVVEAIVSRGGRPDLAGAYLSKVQAPTLLIVGGNDHVVVKLNREAAAELKTKYRLEVIPRAGHLFEEPGTLERVAVLAREWFEDHLNLTKRYAS